MPDIIDDAQRHEALFLAHALARVGHAEPREQQLVINGEIRCLECEEPIPLGRLKMVPCAVRCVECQKEEEARGWYRAGGAAKASSCPVL